MFVGHVDLMMLIKVNYLGHIDVILTESSLPHYQCIINVLEL